MPGIVVERRNGTGKSNPVAQPVGVCYVGIGNRSKRVRDEAVVKGQVLNEALTVASSSPHTATLANRALRRSDLTSIVRTITSGSQTTSQTLSSGQWAFNRAYVTGSVTGTVDVSTKTAFTATSTSSLNFALEMDGIQAITVRIGYAAVAAYTVSGRELRILYPFSGTAGNAGTQADFAAAINAGLSSAAGTTLGFGSAYSACASVVSSSVRITSQTSGSAGDVQLFAALGTSSMTVIFGSATLSASTIVTIADSAYNASATYAATYIALVDTVDTLVGEPTAVLRVGNFPNQNNFAVTDDYLVTSGDIDWTPDSSAVVNGVSGTAKTYNLVTGTSDVFSMGLDGLTVTDFDIIVASGDTKLNFSNAATSGAVTITQMVQNINAIANWAWGPRYQGIAAPVSTTGFTVTSPLAGRSQSQIVLLTSAGSATAAAQQLALTEAFGVTAPYLATGAGETPTQGSTYYVTYDYVRPSSEYNIPVVHTEISTVYDAVGEPSAAVFGYNPLSIASNIAVEVGAPLWYTIMINDTTSAGAPTSIEILAALNAAARTSAITEIVVVGEAGTRALTWGDELSFVAAECSPTIKRYKRMFAGAAANTVMGDSDTSGTLRYAPRNSFRVDTESTARGRVFWCVGPQQANVTKDVRLDDGTTVTVTLDHTFIAAAAAAQRATMTSPADTLTRKTVSCFNISDVTAPWSEDEMLRLNQSGCMVLGLRGSQLVWVEGVTTERAGGADPGFEIDSGTYQVDSLVRAWERVVDDTLVGLVPLDPTNFVLDIKIVLQSVWEQKIANGDVGPLVDDAGNARNINPSTDIIVTINRSDPRVYRFKAAPNRRYPALKFMGEIAVDSTRFFG